MADPRNFGVYLPTTAVYDPESLARNSNIDPAIKEFIIVSGQYYTNIANVLNLKETSYYLTTELVNSQLWFRTSSTDGQSFKNAFRLVVNFGTLPNAGSTSVAHNIQGLTAGVMSWTRIYATATDAAGNGITFDYNPTGDISVTADLTNVTITTLSDYTAYTTTYVVLEYLKN